MNSEYYKGLLERVRNDVRRKRPEKWANGFILHHNNTPWATVCPHPPYSPDLAPCDFWLFPKVKITMKCKRFESIQDIEAGTKAQL
jgi:transposase